MHKLGQRYSLSNVWNDKIVCVEMNASSEVTGLTDHYIPNIIFNCSHPQLFFIEPLKNHYLYVSFNYWYFSTSIKLKSGKAPNHQNICLCVWWVFFFMFSKRWLNRYATTFPVSSHRKPSKSFYGTDDYLLFKR